MRSGLKSQADHDNEPRRSPNQLRGGEVMPGKFIITVRVTFAAVVAYFVLAAFVDYWRLKTTESEIRAELHVGDSVERIESVLRSRALQPFYSADQHRYSALISTHGHKRNFLYVYVDEAKSVTRIEIKTLLIL